MTFVKGKSGNPRGRQPGSFSLVELLKGKLKQIPEGQKEMVAMKAIDAYLKHLEEGKTEILKDAFDRIDGRPKAAEDDLGTEQNPINTVHKVVWE